MGGSGSWFKSLIPPKKPSTNNQVKSIDKSKRKWKLWRNSSESIGFGTSMKKGHGFVAYDKYSCSSFVVNEQAFAAAMAAVVRTPHKDFLLIKQEWSAIRIQSAFRGFLVVEN
ncbi:protein IQ-DOMAIN 7-like isoform X2 [Trifolium pratense]|uniref:protein IQ-DOMAIN 7-like isoform X2 n=1 Tax=Trifolium pratense TaxID=57577 RepID=UPI001E693E12|nr:protein IQ-DOMAIN 7-like isoform X2 [Trifolium pratense]